MLTNLPEQVTSFVGRQREATEAAQLLSTTRLLTLTGSGGCGKTRLALHVAHGVQEAFPDGVWFVDLAPVAAAGLVTHTIGTALSIHDSSATSTAEGLVDYLEGRSLCLLLDNCEHLVEAVATLTDRILRGCPAVRILATSREPLGIAGETVWRVPSLSVPANSGGDMISLDELLRSEAAQLFIDRAQAASPGFAVTDESAPVLAEICRRLDGIPLAIELAAARVRAFSVEQIAPRLDDRFHLLTSGQRTALPRHRTLEATVEWSYNLLSGPERTLLHRLSIFAGGFSLEATEAVGAGEPIRRHAVLDLLAQLVDKSLVTAEHSRGAVRYRLLETLRQYAFQRLQDCGEEGMIRERHLAYFLSLAEECEPRLRGADERAVLDLLEGEHDNFRAALEWTLAQPRDDDAGLRLGNALAWVWYLRGYQEEGLQWLLRQLSMHTATPAARMKALAGAGWLAHHRRNAGLARELLEESLGISRALRDRETTAWVLHLLGRVAYYEGDAEAARSYGEASLAIASELGDDWLTGWALHLLGLAAYVAADYQSARSYYMRSLSIRLDLGFGEGVAILRTLIGLVALRQDELAEALACYREAIIVIKEVVGPPSVGTFMGCFAYLAARLDQPVRAARLAAATTALIERYRPPAIPLFEPIHAEAVALARRSLDEETYAAAAAEGKALSVEAAIAEAFAIEVPGRQPVATGATTRTTGPELVLTEAEKRVLQLLVTGATTKEIASALVIAISTVDRHLTHIYQKLGVRNRAEAVAKTVGPSASRAD
jgi:non-specific serine/threonine protein kinase